MLWLLVLFCTDELLLAVLFLRELEDELLFDGRVGVEGTISTDGSITAAGLLFTGESAGEVSGGGTDSDLTASEDDDPFSVSSVNLTQLRGPTDEFSPEFWASSEVVVVDVSIL